MLAAALMAVSLNLARAPHGLRDLLVLRHYHQRLQSEREREQAENRELQTTITRLQSDDIYIQRIIRKELGYARSNELIYRFVNDSGTPPANPP